ncbi:PIG-L deacetylase family protein [Nibricoccus sp. IMCC34717]|uniref:PIG-L deacetylase family protein n=1 Tax=Nibricoccus sp. IMCC34717 TaxID=3034021 RepID=UPI00384B1729
MRFSSQKADVYVPNGSAPDAALAQVTHLCIAAHQDDIEIMAHSAICDCLDNPALAFGGVVVTNGAGSPRSGPFAAYTDEQMQEVRRLEQRDAARLGQYRIQIQLAHPSADVKQPGHPAVVADLEQLLLGCRPDTLFLHNPADKHETHIGVLGRCFDALRRLPADRRPRRVLGCEVWRDLDWLADDAKVALDSGRRIDLAAELLKVFASQVAGGKRYDVATIGRRSANATFHTSHATDRIAGITWAMDLTPALQDGGPSLEALCLSHLRTFEQDVSARLRRCL